MGFGDLWGMELPRQREDQDWSLPVPLERNTAGLRVLPAEKVAVIVNPKSAYGRTGRKWPALKEAIAQSCNGPVFFMTECCGHGTELVRAALKDGCTRVISVGGDGTHYEVANGFFENGRPLNPDAVMAILPHGTGNDLAKTLKIPRNPWKALESLASERIVTADLGRITCARREGGTNTCYFQNTCRMGIGGEVVDLVNGSSKRFGGFLTFLNATLRALVTYRDKPMRVEIDNIVFQQHVKEIIIAKGQFDGGGMHVAPHAQLDNGLFDVYVIGKVGIADAMLNLPKLYRGRLRERPDVVKYFRARRVMATSSTTVKINTDGEGPGVLPATVEIVPAALRIVVGPDYGK